MVASGLSRTPWSSEKRSAPGGPLAAGSLVRRCLKTWARGQNSDSALARAVELDSEPILIAQTYFYRGDLDSAFQWLRLGLKSERLDDIGDISLDPVWRSLVEDARSAPLLSEHGVTNEQLTALEFKMVMPQIGN